MLKILPDERTGGPLRVAEGGWQPIGTAPKDGRRIIVWVPGAPQHVFTAHWIARLGAFWLDGEYDIQPTHWMPLPKPPSEGKT